MRYYFILCCMLCTVGLNNIWAQTKWADSLLHFDLYLNQKDTIKPAQNLTWQNLHELTVALKLHGLTAHYGVTHRKGIVYIEISGTTKQGWAVLGVTEIPFTLSASYLLEPIAIYSYLKMNRASGLVQVCLKKIVLKNEQQIPLNFIFSDKLCRTFTLVGKDSTW